MRTQMKYLATLIVSLVVHVSTCMNSLASAYLSPVCFYSQQGCQVHQSTKDPSRKKVLGHDQVSPRTTTTMGMVPTENVNIRNYFSIAQSMSTALTSTLVGLALAGSVFSSPGLVHASDRRQVGDISASGLLFKDKLNVVAFEDPKVQGVTLYLSDFSRPVADKLLNGDIFSEPSSASMTCVRSGPMSVSTDISTSKEGEELLKEDRSFFKSIVVRRIYDKEANNVVYVSYASKVDASSDSNKSRFRSSLCSLHVE